jgi:hypothetical protein
VHTHLSLRGSMAGASASMLSLSSVMALPVMSVLTIPFSFQTFILLKLCTCTQ